MALTLLLGGARSGKSALAERIRRHRGQRPADWRTVEEPFDLETAIANAPAGTYVLVDCLTLWVSNLVEQGLPDEQVGRRARAAADVAAGRPGPTVVVSNEVGSGIVPAEPLARRYRDLLGQVNAVWAAEAGQALLLVAGRAVPLLDPLAALGLEPETGGDLHG